MYFKLPHEGAEGADMLIFFFFFFIRMRFNVARLFIYWSTVFLRVRIDTYMYLKAVQMGT